MPPGQVLVDYLWENEDDSGYILQENGDHLLLDQLTLIGRARVRDTSRMAVAVRDDSEGRPW
jgi:hypothetical protein